ncbi:hypothetical protein ABVT39_002108 [Epinephelus coioides]
MSDRAASNQRSNVRLVRSRWAGTTALPQPIRIGDIQAITSTPVKLLVLTGPHCQRRRQLDLSKRGGRGYANIIGFIHKVECSLCSSPDRLCAGLSTDPTGDDRLCTTSHAV